MIDDAYWGYCPATAEALENDFVSSPSTLFETDVGAALTAAAAAAAYPAVRSAPKIDCMIAPPRSRWRSAVPEAIPARLTGTEPVSECDAGVPANPTQMPTKT